jgi:uncharacterized protein YydD (DUF2326 family)
MKLSKIYSNEPFHEVVFNEGFNVILGQVTKPKDKNVDSHNLGKTTLIHVIDFLMLKQLNKEHFFNKHEKLFKDYVFFLEILLNSGKYLTIRRSVEEPTKISFKTHVEKYQNFLEFDKWDDKNVSFVKAKELLNRYLAFDVLPDIDYRKTITYFLRSQKDYDDVFQLSKNFKHKDWKPLLLDLLGFKGDIANSKYTLEESREEKSKTISDLQKHFSVDTNEIDRIKGLIDIKSEEHNELQLKVDNFDFYQREKELNHELVETIETEIAESNALVYSLNYELSQIEESLRNNLTYDINEVLAVFNETKVYFPDTLKRSYDELIDFNKKLSVERSKYLIERQEKLQKELTQLQGRLSELNANRSMYLKVLQNKDSFKKFKIYQQELVKSQSEIFRLQSQLEGLGNISRLKLNLDDIDNQIDAAKKSIEQQIVKGNELYVKIRKDFSKFIKEIINHPAIISITLNNEGNVEFNAEIQTANELETTSEGSGTTYKKILCAAFDLSILQNFINKSFYRFVYHDGILEGLDNRKKNNYIALVKRLCQEHRIQYILTSIQDDLPILDTGQRMQFKDEEIALVLSDAGPGAKLFMQNF